MSLVFRRALATLLSCLLPVVASAQSYAAPSTYGGQYTFGTVRATGQLGNALTYTSSYAPPANYTLDWSNDGTAATACTYMVIGSSDARHWHNVSGTLSCASNGSLVLPSNATGDSFSVASKPYPYISILVLTYTAADNTTAVVFRYTRGS